MKQVKYADNEIQEVEKLFSHRKEESISPLGMIGYTKGPTGHIAYYLGDYCHLKISLSSGNIKNLSIFSFCMGYMIHRHQIFRSFNEYQSSLNIEHKKNDNYTISSDINIRTFDLTSHGIGSGYIDREKDSIHIFYQEKMEDQPQDQKYYQFQIEQLGEDTLLHIYDEKKRKLLESFLLEGKKKMEDLPFCDLENKSLKKMFEGRNDENN